MVTDPETGEEVEAYDDDPSEYGWKDADSAGVIRFRHKIEDGRVFEFRAREGLRTCKALQEAMDAEPGDGHFL